MLIEISKDAAEIAAQNEHALHAIEDLGGAGARGEHLVIARRDVLKALVVLTDISERTRGYFRRVAGRYSELGALFNGFVERILVTAEGGIVRDDLGWKVPLGALVREGILCRSQLVAEHGQDGDLFVEAGYDYLRGAKLASVVKLRVTVRDGGGSGVPGVFGRSVREELGPVLCIVDSDKRFPLAAVGDNARRCAAVLSNPPPWVARLEVLAVREVENLVPLGYLAAAYAADRYEAVETLCDLGRTCEEALIYGDIKQGMYLVRILGLPEGSAERQFWIDVSGRDVFRGRVDERCREDERCRRAPHCRCIVVPVIGDNSSRKVTDWMHSVSPQKRCEELKKSPRPWLDRWERIGELVAAWCCALPALRA